MNNVKLIVIDVDGTMTDGGIYYDENGNELKKFCTKDAAGFFAAHKVGIEIMVLTGRECVATTRRMNELKVDYLFQNVKNKVEFLENFMKNNNISKNEMAYIGDDLNDLPPMKLVGYIGCPADSCQEIREVATYISPVKGGYGVVRDVIEHMLRESGDWDKAVADVYGFGI
jgi:3-deoxy-D-manno-octulosonate 8-phosphate phosphatase (KDO 8-P phosphatase)